MRLTHTLCVVLAAILTMAFLDPIDAASPEPAARGPWTLAIHDENGQVLAASGRDALKIPVALTVATTRRDDVLQRSTTYVRGRSAVRIDRTYRIAGALEIDYECEGERLSFALQLDEMTGEALAIYTLPDGRIFSLWVDQAGRVASGDVDGLRRALTGGKGLIGLLHHYARDTESLGVAVAEAGRIFQLRWPDQGCVDTCSMGCDAQCAFECKLDPITCQVCGTACGIGCFIGCAGSI